MYLWHYPLLLLMNPASDVSAKPWWVYLCQVAVVVGVSELCYRFIETPFRHGAAGRILAQLRDNVKRCPLGSARRRFRWRSPGIACLVALGGITFVLATSALSEDGAALLQGSNDAASRAPMRLRRRRERTRQRGPRGRLRHHDGRRLRLAARR
ncbi:MAG: hypothetical protein ACLTSX_10545 [Collinsella sp.]